eukprot:1195242-Prorocentrum_minimum.AAC.2
MMHVCAERVRGPLRARAVDYPRHLAPPRQLRARAPCGCAPPQLPASAPPSTPSWAPPPPQHSNPSHPPSAKRRPTQPRLANTNT